TRSGSHANSVSAIMRRYKSSSPSPERCARRKTWYRGPPSTREKSYGSRIESGSFSFPKRCGARFRGIAAICPPHRISWSASGRLQLGTQISATYVRDQELSELAGAVFRLERVGETSAIT